MMKKQLKWFVFATCFLVGIVSCSKDEEEAKEQRLINKENKEAGEAFLQNNANQSGVVQTGTKLQYEIKVQGDGIRPDKEDSVNVNYTGKLIDGTVFTSVTGETLLLGNQIEGFKEGLLFMREGSKHILYIPQHLAYKATSKTVSYNGEAITILPFSVLIFEVTLNKVIRN